MTTGAASQVSFSADSAGSASPLSFAPESHTWIDWHFLSWPTSADIFLGKKGKYFFAVLSETTFYRDETQLLLNETHSDFLKEIFRVRNSSTSVQ